jgi:endonuclease YncB( thermonuclease family)
MGSCGSIDSKLGDADNKSKVVIMTESASINDELLHKSTYANTPEFNLNEYKIVAGKVVKVYDGDTFWLAVIIDGKPCRFKCRLYGVDCPELRSFGETKLLAQAAKKFTEEFCLGKIVNVEILNGKTLIENNKKHKIVEKYGRLVVRIRINDHVGGRDLTEELIRAGYATPYFGVGQKFKTSQT